VTSTKIFIHFVKAWITRFPGNSKICFDFGRCCLTALGQLRWEDHEIMLRSCATGYGSGCGKQQTTSVK